MSTNTSVCSFAAKYRATAPYHFFLTPVYNEPATHGQHYTVSFHEIMDRALGELVECFHISPTIDLEFIFSQYKRASQKPRVTLIYSHNLTFNDSDSDSNSELDFDSEVLDIDYKQYKKTHREGHMFSNLSILKYRDDKIRLVISTASLCFENWNRGIQGLWVSPFLPLLPVDADDTDGESVTNFKRDFIEYLSEHKEPQVFGWLSLLYRTDFSSVKVFFLGSVPGTHQGPALNLWGRNKLKKILSEHAVLPENARDWPIVAQTHDLGYTGETYFNWLNYNVQAMAMEKDKKIIYTPEFKLLYPSKKDVPTELEGMSHCYEKDFYLKQQWIKEYLHQWKSEKIRRLQVFLSHFSCYTRISPDGTKIPWFVLTSMGMLRNSWGQFLHRVKEPHLYITRYEAGVVFVPKFLVKQDTFPIKQNSSSEMPIFLLPFDLPLTPYEPSDEPVCKPSVKNESSSALEGELIEKIALSHA